MTDEQPDLPPLTPEEYADAVARIGEMTDSEATLILALRIEAYEREEERKRAQLPIDPGRASP